MSDRHQCSLCPEWLSRPQDRDRHELTAHLPYFFHCPVVGCAWRGNRFSEFKKHWQEQEQDQSHNIYREQHGDTPEQSLIETFDPQDILDRIKNGTISLMQGQEEAVLMVQVKSFELEKLGMMMEPWGQNRRLKNLKG